MPRRNETHDFFAALVHTFASLSRLNGAGTQRHAMPALLRAPILRLGVTLRSAVTALSKLSGHAFRHRPTRALHTASEPGLGLRYRAGGQGEQAHATPCGNRVVFLLLAGQAMASSHASTPPSVFNSSFMEFGGEQQLPQQQDASLGLIILNRPLPHVTAHLWQRGAPCQTGSQHACRLLCLETAAASGAPRRLRPQLRGRRPWAPAPSWNMC